MEKDWIDEVLEEIMMGIEPRKKDKSPDSIDGFFAASDAMRADYEEYQLNNVVDNKK